MCMQTRRLAFTCTIRHKGYAMGKTIGLVFTEDGKAKQKAKYACERCGTEFASAKKMEGHVCVVTDSAGVCDALMQGAKDGSAR